jgi:hypothetical protein
MALVPGFDTGVDLSFLFVARGARSCSGPLVVFSRPEGGAKSDLAQPFVAGAPSLRAVSATRVREVEMIETRTEYAELLA